MKTTGSFQKILFSFCAFIALMLAARMFYSGKMHYLFLVSNIFLVWVPFVISSLFDSVINQNKWKQALVFCCWLAFFPNALYIVTDLIHLELERSQPS